MQDRCCSLHERLEAAIVHAREVAGECHERRGAEVLDETQRCDETRPGGLPRLEEWRDRVDGNPGRDWLAEQPSELLEGNFGRNGAAEPPGKVQLVPDEDEAIVADSPLEVDAKKLPLGDEIAGIIGREQRNTLPGGETAVEKLEAGSRFAGTRGARQDVRSPRLYTTKTRVD
jgi:hypothetical protein